jgi:hypothetical protein
LDRLYPAVSSKVRVSIRLSDGTVLRGEFDRNSERRYHYPERSDIEEKCRAATARVITAKRADAIIDAVWRVDGMQDVRELVGKLSGE